MPQIYCGYATCEYNEEGLCHATAVRISANAECLTYNSIENVPDELLTEQGDSLTWDEEYFEYEFLDDEMDL